MHGSRTSSALCMPVQNPREEACDGSWPVVILQAKCAIIILGQQMFQSSFSKFLWNTSRWFHHWNSSTNSPLTFRGNQIVVYLVRCKAIEAFFRNPPHHSSCCRHCYCGDRPVQNLPTGFCLPVPFTSKSSHDRCFLS